MLRLFLTHSSRYFAGYKVLKVVSMRTRRNHPGHGATSADLTLFDKTQM
jgi:hypothetical protein